MRIAWMQIVKMLPEIQEAIGVIGSKDWYKSESIVYQLVKTVVTILAACGIYLVLSEQDIQAIGVGVSSGVVAVCTLLDALFAIWLRTRAKTSIKGSAAEVEVAVAVTTLRSEDPASGTVVGPAEVKVAQAVEVLRGESLPTILQVKQETVK